MSIKKLLTTLITIPLVFSCLSTPPQIYRLDVISTEHDSYWENGSEFHNLKNDQIDMNIAFYEMRDDMLIFDVKIRNTGYKEVTVNHKLIETHFNIREAIYEEKYNTYTQKIVKVKTDEYKEYTLKRWAVDPEAVIFNINNEIAQTESVYESTKSSNSTIDFLDAVIDIATIGSRTKEEKEQDRIEDQRRKENNRADELEYKNELSNLRNDKTYWENRTIRMTTLKPSEEIKGKIHFEVPNNANKFLTISFRDKSDSIDFWIRSY